MILVFGFRTPAYSEIPVVLYLGADGDEANRIIDTDPHPRIEKVVNPHLHSVKHWDEAASEVFEKSKKGKKLDEPVVANVHPHLEPGALVYGSEGYRLTTKGFVAVPERKHLLASGYSEEAAQTIISRQQAMSDAFEKDENITRSALAGIADAVAPAPPVPAQPEVKEEDAEPKDDRLDELTITDLQTIAIEKGIDVHGCKVKKDYLDTIRLYLELDHAHNAEEIKALAVEEQVEGFTGLKLKRDFVNAIVARRRAQ